MVSKINSYVFYQDKAGVGLCRKEMREEVKYEKEINPIRMSILDCSQQYMEMLFSVLACDKKQFSDMIIDELNNDKHCLYFN